MAKHASGDTPVKSGRRLTVTEQILAGAKLWMKEHPEAGIERPEKILPGTEDWDRFEARAKADRTKLLQNAYVCGALAVDSVAGLA